MKTGCKQLAALLLAIVFVGPVQAETVNLTDLLTGQTITAGDKEFSDWEVLLNDAFPGELADPGPVVVSSLDDGGLDPGPGLSYAFNGALELSNLVGDFAYLDFGWSYVVTAAEGLLIKDVSMGRGGNCSDCFDLGWAIIQDIYDADGGFLGQLYDIWEFDESGENYSEGIYDLDFAGQESLIVDTNVYFFSFLEDGRIELSNLTQRFSQEVAAVPEPGTLVLLGLGLIGMGAARRRLR